MAWIEVHEGLVRHRKTLRLARLLDVHRTSAAGHMLALWLWSLSNAPEGVLGHLDSEDIAVGGEWDGPPDTFVGALVASGFVDAEGEGLFIHNWQEYAGRLMERRQADAERKRKGRMKRRINAANAVARTGSKASHGHPEDVPRTSAATVPNLTLPKSKRGARARAWTPPEWFSPLTKLQGYEARDYRKSASKIGVICSEYDVDVGSVVLAFCDYWPVGRIKHEWTSPVRALLTTIDIQIDKLKRVNGRQPNEPRHSGTQLDRIKAEAAEHARRRSDTG